MCMMLRKGREKKLVKTAKVSGESLYPTSTMALSALSEKIFDLPIRSLNRKRLSCHDGGVHRPHHKQESQGWPNGTSPPSWSCGSVSSVSRSTLAWPGACCP